MSGSTRGGNDKLDGGDGNDFLYGDAAFATAGVKGGNDVLNGGAGDDKFWGGTGNDTFVFEGPGFGADIIHDFGRTDGDQDTMDLEEFDITFEELHIEIVGSDSIITLPSGVGEAADTITVIGVTGLTAENFELG